MHLSSSHFKAIAAALFAVATAAAQSPDASANGSLKGNYFVREVLMTGTVAGSVAAATSVIGVANFDGNGHYTFSGQGNSLASGLNTALSLHGVYSVGSNGLFQMTSLADPTDVEFGGVAVPVGPSAFVASATEGANVTMLVGIPAGANVSNSSFKGNYTAGTIDFPGANINSAREATFSLAPDGAGNLGTVSISGTGANLGGTALKQTDPGVTYSLSGAGSGTVNFGTTANSQLVSGSKTFYISADGNIILGGSPSGFDMLVGIRSLPAGTGSNATVNNEYFMGALEDSVDRTGQTVNAIDAFYGSGNANGTGSSIFHSRLQGLKFSVFDYTYDSQYSVAANGTIPFGGDTPYGYTFGVPNASGNAQAFIGTGDAVGSSLYSLTLGLTMPKYTGSGVYLIPNGIVSSASFAPITNPIAPNELITLVGTGFTNTATHATNLPLPTTLGGVQVTINGIMAPLDSVSPTQLNVLVPSSITPANNIYYATIQVMNSGVPSNSVTIYTSATAPGVFANPVAMGAAAAQHADLSQVNSSSPANAGETIILYAGGLGAVTPPVVPDGGSAPSSPLSTVNDENVSVDFGGVNGVFPISCSTCYVGLTPTTAGLYQIDLPVPAGTASSPYIDVGTTDGYTSEATLSVAGGASAVARAAEAEKRLEQRKMRATGKTVLRSRIQ